MSVLYIRNKEGKFVPVKTIGDTDTAEKEMRYLGAMSGLVAYQLTDKCQGDVFYCIDNDKQCFYIYDGTKWVPLKGGESAEQIAILEARIEELEQAIAMAKSRKVPVVLKADAWEDTEWEDTYVQHFTIDNIGVEDTIKVLLTIEQVVEFSNKDVAFHVGHIGNAVNVYCISEEKLTNDYSVRLKISEVDESEVDEDE